jgi:adenosylhomocysteine nucleosidase
VRNDGVISSGDHNQIFNRTDIGPDTTILNGAPSPHRAVGPRRPGHWQVGVITVIPAETMALNDLLDRGGTSHEETHNGRRFREARLQVGDTAAAVVSTQSIGPGQRQAAAAYQHLRARYAPPIIVLVGIASGIHPDVGLGDVVVGTRIIYYDARREDPGETHYRGESHDVPPAVQHSLNAFFSRCGEPAVLRSRVGRHTETFDVRPGPIGSGEAVIRDDNSPARQWLRRYNDKTLATETEGAALAHAFHEDRDADTPPRGWLVIRGISDHANPNKNDLHHGAASRHAVETFQALLHYLVSP